MKITPQTYPLLLTMAEPGALQCDIEHWHDCYFAEAADDVYRANYEQGATLAEDRLMSKTAVSTRAGIQEIGLGWQDANSAWVRYTIPSGRSYSVVSCTPGQKPVPYLEMDSSSVIFSASQRYRWTSHSDCEGKTDSIRQWDEQAQRQTTVWQGKLGNLHGVCAATNEDRLVFSMRTEDGGRSVLDWKPELECLQKLPLPNSVECSEIALSPDGKTLAFVDHREDAVRIADLSSGKILHTISENEDEDEYDCVFGDIGWHHYGQPAWSPDGSRIFYTRHSQGFKEYDKRRGSTLFVATANGSERRALLGFPWTEEAVEAVQVGPQNRRS